MLRRFFRRMLFLHHFNEKTKAGIDLKIKDIQLMAKAYRIDPADVKVILRRILSDSRDHRLDEKIIHLLNSVDEISPFSEFPSEVRQSLEKIQVLLDASEVDGKEYILGPILQNISAHEALKERNSIAWCFISLLIFLVILHIFGVLEFYAPECKNQLFQIFGIL